MRFVHAADLHLDSPFRGLLASDSGIADVLRRATFKAYENIVDLCIAERVDALFIAGDVYDGADRSLPAQLEFIRGLQRLDEAGIRSFICHGNHDPLDGWEARLDYPESSYRFGPQVERVPVFPDDPDRAVVYGMSYPTREVRENLIPGFQADGSERFSIGLVHANVGANTGHEAYAPCTLSDLEASGIDYWALGHVHARQILREHGPAAVYPGNTQGRHPNERGARGVYLVEVGESGRVDLQFRPVDVVRWEALEADIAGLEDEQGLVDEIRNLVGDARNEADGRDLLYRLAFTGRGALHATVRREEFADGVRTELNEELSRSRPFAFCERVEVNTSSPVDREERSRAEDFVGDLLRQVDAIRADPELLDELAKALESLYQNPRAARYLRDAAPTGSDLEILLQEAEELCLDGLVGEDVR